MAQSAPHIRWQIIGRTVRGASHARTGLPNQDALGWAQQYGPGLSSIVAVSDGHGSAKSFRSHIGSRFATEIALALGQEFLSGQPDLKNLSAVKRTAEERLPQEMARRWREAVDSHVEDNPFSAEELSGLEQAGGSSAREAVTSNPALAYGATILTVLVVESFILYLQLGDGDILTVSGSGEVTRPLPKDERLFANETTSLSSQTSWSDFRFGFQTLVGPPPALILLSTDGYANSFIDDEAFLKVGKDFLEILRSDRLENVDRSLERWLTEASNSGSGDDITLAIICNPDAVSKPSGDQPSESARGCDSSAAQPPIEQATIGPASSAPEGQE